MTPSCHSEPELELSGGEEPPTLNAWNIAVERRPRCPRRRGGRLREILRFAQEHLALRALVHAEVQELWLDPCRFWCIPFMTTVVISAQRSPPCCGNDALGAALGGRRGNAITRQEKGLLHAKRDPILALELRQEGLAFVTVDHVDSLPG